LDAFKPYLGERTEAAKPYWITLSFYVESLRLEGMKVKKAYKSYVWQFKPITKEPVVRFETAPGQQMQVDLPPLRAAETN
jgi:transposase